MPGADTLSAQLDRLADFDPGPFPVVSLYLNMQPDQHGRDHFEPFLRKELHERVKTYGADGPERASLEQDVKKIESYLADVDPSANGLALFACAGADLFQAVQLAAPIDEHKLYISDQPHLYPLAHLLDAYPRFAVLLANTNAARIFVVAANAVQRTQEVEGTKTKRHKMGGWSQARYQRHIDNYHVSHAKEVVDTLARIVHGEGIGSIIIAGDDVIVPLLKEQLPKDLAERIVDVVNLDIRTPEHEVLETSVALMRHRDAESDRERVDALVGAYRSNGLAVLGVKETRRALEMGQVDELVITAEPSLIAAKKGKAPSDKAASEGEMSAEERVADELVVKARQTSASVRFIEDASLLSGFGGVGAFLRFKVK
jgi:peptide chain release factor subunit 1